MSRTQRPRQKRSNVSASREIVALQNAHLKKEFSSFHYLWIRLGSSAAQQWSTEQWSVCEGLFFFFKLPYYKMPLWAESRADPRKIQANMLTDQWRQRLTRNLRPAGGETAAANTWFTPSCHLNPHRMLENRHEAGYLTSSTVNETTQLTHTGINSIRTQTRTPPICLLYTTLMISIYPGSFKLNYKALFKALRVNMLFSQSHTFNMWWETAK